MEKEVSRPQIEIFKRPSDLTIMNEDGNRLVGVYPGINIGVTLDGKVVWNKSVHTHHVGILGMTTRDRLYSFKVGRISRQANKIARNLSK